MTAISTLIEDFTGGTLGTTVDTTNTIFTSAPAQSGGTAVFITDPFDSTLKMMETNTVATTLTRGMTFPATATMWFRFDVALPTAFDANTAILAGYIDATGTASTGKFFDVRVTTTGTLQLRDNVSSVYATPVLTANVKHRVYVQVQCSATAGTANRWLRMMVYSGGDNLTLSYDSGKQTLTQAALSISNLRVGELGSCTAKARFGRFRGDDSTQPLPGSTGTVSLAADTTTPAANATVTLTATTTGTGTLAFQQTAGTAVTLSGTGNTRTFSLPSAASATFTATYGGATSSAVVVTASATGVTVSAGADQVVDAKTVVTVTAATSGAGTLAWAVSPSVTLTGTGTSRSFTAPAALTAVVYTVTITYGTASDSVDITVLPHTTWYKQTAGTLKAYYPQRKT